MSYTSSAGVWVETVAHATGLAADKPVTAFRARVLHYNLRHLVDTSTQERISVVAKAGVQLMTTDAGSFTLASPLVAMTTPWSVMRSRKLARPVLRIGAKVTSGTGYISAALFRHGGRQSASFRGALASWAETSFTNTSHAIVIEDAADITWRESRARQPDGFQRMTGLDPSSAGTDEASTVPVMMLDLVIWGRGAAIDLSLIQLREFNGP